MKRIDINVGHKYNQLTYIGPAINVHDPKRLYGNFLCDCGGRKKAKLSMVKSGKIKSCGCLKHISFYPGEKTSRLTFIKEVSTPLSSKVGNFKYGLFRCDCGCDTTTRLVGVKSKHTLSCGCAHRETIAKQGKLNCLPKGDAAKNNLYSSYRRGAKNRNLSFELSFEEFIEVTKKCCNYCGIPPYREHKNKNSNGGYIYNGLDRIDNELGYTYENVVTCCWLCNKLKGALKKEEFLYQVKKIYEFLKGQCML